MTRIPCRKRFDPLHKPVKILSAYLHRIR